jgi:hypothetical protein
MKYNANGGQRRSKTVKMSTRRMSRDEFEYIAIVVKFMETAKQDGEEFAMQILERAKAHWKMTPEEVELMASIIKAAASGRTGTTILGKKDENGP